MCQDKWLLNYWITARMLSKTTQYFYDWIHVHAGVSLTIFTQHR